MGGLYPGGSRNKAKPKPAPVKPAPTGGKAKPAPLPGYPIRVGLDEPTMWGGKKSVPGYSLASMMGRR